MEINYCRKSSLDQIAQTLKSISNDQSFLSFPDDFKLKIKSIKPIETQANPNVTLSNTNLNYILPQGKYKGGTISVSTEEKIITPSGNNQPITASANKVLTKVTVLPVSQTLNSNTKIAIGYTNIGGSSTSAKKQANFSFTFDNSEISEPEGAAIINLWFSVDGMILTQTSNLNGTSNYGVTCKPVSMANLVDPGGVVKSPLLWTKENSNYYNKIYCNNPTVVYPNASPSTGKYYQGYYYCILWGQ